MELQNEIERKDLNMSEKKKVKLQIDVNGQDCDIVYETSAEIVTNALGYTPMDAALKGANLGVSELDDTGKVVSSQLPSFVDDVIEGYLYNGEFYEDEEHTTKMAGESGKIYIDLSTEKTYRWSGSIYTVISETLALGETSSTAYRGDRGKIAYDHSQTAHAPSNAEKNQNAFANVRVGDTTIIADNTSDALTLVPGDNVNITTEPNSNSISISAQDTTYENVTDSTSGLMPSSYKQKLDGIDDNANNYTLPSAGSSLGGVKSGGDVTISSGVITVNDDSHNHVIGNIDGLQTALDGKAPTGHSHQYAGSSGVGGSATSAEKLNTDAGSATQPVYFEDGVPKPTTYTLAKSVPSNAVFTDTKYTHPTTSGNKHIPSGGSSGQILRWSADGTAVWGADNNTTYSTFVKSGSGAKAGLVPAPSTTAGTTKYLREDGTWSVPPDTNTTYSAATTSANGLMTSTMVTKLNGITDSADSVSFSRSLSSGTKVGTITINGTGTDLYAPTNTDTHYTTGLKVGASSTATANAAATNGNVYLNALDNTTVRDSHKITGSGATTVTSDANGVITISSTNTTYTSLKNPYALTIQGNGKTLTNGTYDGSAAKTVNITPSSIGAAASSHTHSYLPLSGGTISSSNYGPLTIERTGSANGAGIVFKNSNGKLGSIAMSSTGVDGLIRYTADSTRYDILDTGNAFTTTTPKANGTAAAGSATTVSRSDHVHPLQTSVSGSSGSCTGNAATATTWATARNINGLSVNGSANRVNYGTCSTAAATQAKIVDCPGFALITGSEITVKFTVTNTASQPTLNVNGTGNKAIKYRGSNITAGYLAANRTYTFRYDGTNYDLVGDINTDTNTDTKVTQTNTTTSSAYRLLMSYNANDTTQTLGARKSAKFTANPSTGCLTASMFKGTYVLLYDSAISGSTATVTITNLWNYSILFVTIFDIEGGMGRVDKYPIAIQKLNASTSNMEVVRYFDIDGTYTNYTDYFIKFQKSSTANSLSVSTSGVDKIGKLRIEALI